MTQEQFERLQKYDIHMSAARQDFMRGLSSTQLRELDALYKEIISQKNPQLLSGCSRCILHSLKDLAQVYYNYIDEQSKPKEEEIIKPKRTRKKTNGKENN